MPRLANSVDPDQLTSAQFVIKYMNLYQQLGSSNLIYFIVSGEVSVYLVKIKVVSITSELISYHFTIVTDTIYIFTPRFGRLRFSSLFQKWILPPLQIFEHL